jgi:hypothetical protein
MIPIKREGNSAFKIVYFKNTCPCLLHEITGFFFFFIFQTVDGILFTILFKNTHLTCKITLPNTLLRYADLPKKFLESREYDRPSIKNSTRRISMPKCQWLPLTCINNSFLAKTPHCIFDSQNLCTNFPKSPLLSAFMPA